MLSDLENKTDIFNISPIKHGFYQDDVIQLTPNSVCSGLGNDTAHSMSQTLTPLIHQPAWIPLSPSFSSLTSQTAQHRNCCSCSPPTHWQSMQVHEQKNKASTWFHFRALIDIIFTPSDWLEFVEIRITEDRRLKLTGLPLLLTLLARCNPSRMRVAALILSESVRKEKKSKQDSW